MMKKFILIFFIMFSVPTTVNAKRGCCSWHGGVAYCGADGYYYCNDGTRSPSCTCYYTVPITPPDNNNSIDNERNEDNENIESSNIIIDSEPHQPDNYSKKRDLNSNYNNQSDKEIIIIVLFIGICIWLSKAKK